MNICNIYTVPYIYILYPVYYIYTWSVKQKDSFHMEIVMGCSDDIDIVISYI